MTKTNLDAFDQVVGEVEVGAKIQINVNEFYYVKYYHTHGIIALMIALQLFLYGFLKNTEVTYFKVDEIMRNAVDGEFELPDGKLINERLFSVRQMIHALDLILILQFWALDYHLIIWNQSSGCFLKQGIDLRWVPRSKKCIYYYYQAYNSAIIRSAVILI